MPESVQSCFELSIHFPVFFPLELFLVAVHGWFALQTNVWKVHSKFMHILVQEFVSSRKYIVSYLVFRLPHFVS